MNTIKCPNCGFENTFGLVFCTNCGTSLYGAQQGAKPTTPTVPKSGSGEPPTVPLPVTSPAASRSSTRLYLILGGVFAVVLLMAGAVVLSAFFFYLGSRRATEVANTANTNASNSVSLPSNTRNRNQPIQNANTSTPKTPDIDETDFAANPFVLPPSVGSYEGQGVMMGNPADDFLGADEVTKNIYSKKGKEVEIVLAKFSAREPAKKGYEDFVKGFKDQGAKILGRRKVKNKAGVTNGEISLFTFSKKWNALIYSDRYGVRFIAPDRFTLAEFAQEFDKVFNTK